MKRYVSICLAIIALLSLLTACGATQSQEKDSPASDAQVTTTDSKTPVTMWFWGCTPEYQDVLQRNLVDVYNSSQDEYELIIEYRNSVDNDIPVALSANEGPDIVYGSGPAFITSYAEAGKLVSMDAYAEKYGWVDRLQTPVYNACKVKDSLYALPNSMFVTGLFYNKEVLDQHGWEVPSTISDLIPIMDAALDEGLYPILFGVKGWRPSLEQLPSTFMTNWAGPEAVYECLTNQRKWNNPDMAAAINAVDEWYKKGYLCNDMMDLSSNEAMQLFVDGGAPFIFNSSSGYQRLASFCESEEDAAKFGFIPFPSGNEGIPDPVYTLAVTATFSINAASECQDAAAEVLNIMMSQDYMETMTAEWPGYWCVPLKDYSKVDTSKMGTLGKQCVELMQTITPAINDGNFGYYSSTFYPAATASVMQNIDTIWYGTSTVDELLDNMDAEFEKEFANGLVPELTAPK